MVCSKTLRLKPLLEQLPPCKGYLVAYSGGADSTALLHLFASIKNVRAIHINHGLQSAAHSWQLHCQQHCDKLNIPLIIEQASLKNSSENACREARYTFFKKHLKQHEILLTAHHAQDQAETVLLKLLRGTGIKGLCGIEKLQKFLHGYLARPLLEQSPQVLKGYLIENNIDWIEDASNLDNSYKRNFIRNQIIPSLQDAFPNAITNISRSAHNSAQSLELLNHQCDFQGKPLQLDKFKNLPQSLHATLLYHWLAHKNLPTPDKVALAQISHDFITAGIDKNPHYKNNYYQLYRWQQVIFCIQNFTAINPTKDYPWDTENTFLLPNDNGVLSYTGQDKLNLIVKFNQKGHKLKTHKHQFSKSIKQLFQDHNISTWQRQNTPFIFHNSELISLGYSWSHAEKYKACIKFKPKDLIM